MHTPAAAVINILVALQGLSSSWFVLWEDRVYCVALAEDSSITHMRNWLVERVPPHMRILGSTAEAVSKC